MKYFVVASKCNIFLPFYNPQVNISLLLKGIQQKSSSASNNNNSNNIYTQVHLKKKLYIAKSFFFLILKSNAFLYSRFITCKVIHFKRFVFVLILMIRAYSSKKSKINISKYSNIYIWVSLNDLYSINYGYILFFETTITGNTADLAMVQKMIIDTLHKEGKSQ